MSLSGRDGSRCFLLGAAVVLILGLLVGPLIPRPALAAFTTCTSDPVIVLSSGAALDLDSSIVDSASDVRSIVYAVHGPAGTHLVSVTSLGPADKVTYYADDAANTFDTFTTVSTGASGIAVTASTKVVSALGLTLGLTSMSGLSGQSLHIKVGGPL